MKKFILMIGLLLSTHLTTALAKSAPRFLEVRAYNSQTGIETLYGVDTQGVVYQKVFSVPAIEGRYVKPVSERTLLNLRLAAILLLNEPTSVGINKGMSKDCHGRTYEYALLGQGNRKKIVAQYSECAVVYGSTDAKMIAVTKNMISYFSQALQQVR